MAANPKQIDVITDVSSENVPKCSHGPALLFSRFNPKTKREQQFYACSAFRDRKYCPLFQWKDEQTKPYREEMTTPFWPENSHRKIRKRVLQFKKLPKTEREMCVTCGLLLLPGERSNHEGQGHSIKTGITKAMLKQPTHLFSALDDNRSYAQYLFSEKCVDFITETLNTLGISHVMCVGCPRIHEALQQSTGQGMVSSLLLDLDHRYLQVYPPHKFCRYNMMNHHFFDGPSSEEIFHEFIKEEEGKKVAMVIDPPFGVMVDALWCTMDKIQAVWRSKQPSSDAALEMPVLWFFPYFMEKRIVEANRGYQMLDYKVDYDNHELFKRGGRKKGSPVRIFTNLPPANIPHPQAEGYWFCGKCERYSSAENQHCDTCGCCPTKDGYTYRHCEKCGRCVKPSRVHCDTCGTCDLPSHVCGQTTRTGCHICGEAGHKRRECPQRGTQESPGGERKRKHQKNDSDIKSKKKKKR